MLHKQTKIIFSESRSIRVRTGRAECKSVCNNICDYIFTGLSMELDRIRLKEAIVMWPDMHSFLELDKFEPISNS